MSDKLEALVERYFSRLRDERGLGAGTKERSFYPALADLFNALGKELKPKVLCLSDLANTGAGHPDFGLYAANQVQKGIPRKGQPPERGVIEMKGVNDERWLTAETKQISKYFGAYRTVIVSNLREFLIIGEGPTGGPTKLEGFQLAPDAKSFWEMVATPQKSAEQIGRAFGEYLKRTLTQSVALREPKDVPSDKKSDVSLAAACLPGAYPELRGRDRCDQIVTDRLRGKGGTGEKWKAESVRCPREKFFQITGPTSGEYGCTATLDYR